MKSFRVLIVDDELPARMLVSSYLKDNEQIEIIGECENGFDAVKAIKELKPDIVFLDVQMPKLTGLEMLELLEESPAIIFTTAYDQYALKAFELNAVDYLLKPFGKDRFNTALQKAKERVEKGEGANTAKKVAEFYQDELPQLDRVVVKRGSQIVILPLDSIFYLQAMDDFVSIHSSEGVFHKSRTMKYFESHLPETGFIRIHRSYIVNVDSIHKLESYDKDAYVAVLKNGEKLRVSRSGYKKIRDKLSI